MTIASDCVKQWPSGMPGKGLTKVHIFLKFWLIFPLTFLRKEERIGNTFQVKKLEKSSSCQRKNALFVHEFVRGKPEVNAPTVLLASRKISAVKSAIWYSILMAHEKDLSCN